MTNKSASIQAIQLVRQVFESVHGNLGILRFNIEKLAPINEKGKKNSKKWKIICNFYETLGSSSPSKYEVTVDLNDNLVVFKKLSGAPTKESKKLEGVWKKDQ